MNLEVSNQEIFLPVILFLIAITAAAILTVKKWSNSLLRVLITTVFIFTIIYIPIVEYWSNWTDIKIFWPNSFIANSSVIVNGETVAANTMVDKIYSALSITTTFLTYYSIVVFIYYINNQQLLLSNKKWVNWIPVVNVFSIAFTLYKRLNKSWLTTTFLLLWMLSTLAWVYYSFFALILVYWGVDSFSFIDHFLFGNFYHEYMADADPEYLRATSTPIGYQMSYLADLASITTPIFTFISGGSLLVILLKIKKLKN